MKSSNILHFLLSANPTLGKTDEKSVNLVK
ncbi:hypothetical protein CHRY9390_03248 [Chryseobacterium aquaeductus]|uniref:Uncharacterized protein n=1 Tax=Chryseobacterium aquaeductus TaxID=2675056 RepID=A0A9N8MJD7_9FLAO|nr:hypothetical protein CHRY9390_03248 [Chryseobacterium potabilaquae]CAD7816870.1 hypothetical protein CHRY9390_03248 [Chryseobacterium aquaeductus]